MSTSFASHLDRWWLGTHHGAMRWRHLDAYLDEFVFRFNRRYYPMAGFATLLGLGASQPPTTGEDILSPRTPERTVRRRGRATGLTSVRFPNPPTDAGAPELDAALPGGTLPA